MIEDTPRPKRGAMKLPTSTFGQPLIGQLIRNFAGGIFQCPTLLYVIDSVFHGVSIRSKFVEKSRMLMARNQAVDHK